MLAAALTADALAGLAVGWFGLADLEPLRAVHSAAIVGFALVCSLGPNDALKTALIARLWSRRPLREPAGSGEVRHHLLGKGA